VILSDTTEAVAAALLAHFGPTLQNQFRQRRR
jgi:hypothetical protein